MTLSLHRITPDLIPGCHECTTRGFSATELSPAMWVGGHPPPEAAAHMISRDEKTLATQRGAFWYCVRDSSVTENDGVIAVGKWRHEDEETFDEQREPPPETPTPGMRPAVPKKFFGMIGEVRKGIMGRREYWHLVVLATDPAHERRGAGSMLIEVGLKEADKAGLDAYLDATKTGKPLYERMGFVEQKETSLDLAQFIIEGVNGVSTVWSMLRKPKDGTASPDGEAGKVDDRGVKAVGEQ